MKITNRVLQISEKTIIDDIKVEAFRGERDHGKFNSHHELYAVLKEELDEFWDSIKENKPDPIELLQICAVAYRGVLQLCDEARSIMETHSQEKK